MIITSPSLETRTRNKNSTRTRNKNEKQELLTKPSPKEEKTFSKRGEERR
jgi:hypothetical protein